MREMVDCKIVKVSWGETGAHVRECKKTGKKTNVANSKIVYFEYNNVISKGFIYDITPIVGDDGLSHSFKCKIQCRQAKRTVDQQTCRVRFHALFHCNMLSTDIIDESNWEITKYPSTDHVRM